MTIDPETFKRILEGIRETLRKQLEGGQTLQTEMRGLGRRLQQLEERLFLADQRREQIFTKAAASIDTLLAAVGKTAKVVEHENQLVRHYVELHGEVKNLNEGLRQTSNQLWRAGRSVESAAWQTFTRRALRMAGGAFLFALGAAAGLVFAWQTRPPEPRHCASQPFTIPLPEGYGGVQYASVCIVDDG